MSEGDSAKSWVRVSSASSAVLSLGAAMVVAAVFGGAYLESAFLAMLAVIALACVAGYYLFNMSYVSIDRHAVALRRPLRRERRIVWPDIRYVLTDRTTYAFVGANKALAIRLTEQLSGADTLRVFINDLTRARGVPVMQTRARPSIKTHNADVDRSAAAA